MNDMDVRMCLAKGVVPLPSETRQFAPEVNPPDQGWRWIDVARIDRPIPVHDVRRACLVRMQGMISDGNFLNERVPASFIASIAFPTEQLGTDWVARSASFEGLPSNLPSVEVKTHLQFRQAKPTDHSTARAKAAVLPTEADRVGGVFTSILAAGEASPNAMISLAEVNLPDRGLVLGLIHDTVSVESPALDLCFEILGDPAWHGGFDPLELLEAMRSSLTEVTETDRVQAWAVYVGEVLRNLRDAGGGTLLDTGDVLLRALQLVLRSTPLTVREIDNQIAARGDSVGPMVGQLSRFLAAWYEGFGALAGAVKKRSEIYSIGCRSVVGSSSYPLEFTIEYEKDRTGLGRAVLLLESGHEILSHVVRPRPEFMEAYYATETVCQENGWSLSYDDESGLMRLTVGDRVIEADLISEREICWCATMPAGKRPRARKWPKGFLESVLEAASTCRCTISSTSGYPQLEFRSYQLLGTMDRAEVGFHIEAISHAMDQIEAISCAVQKVDGS